MSKLPEVVWYNILKRLSPEYVVFFCVKGGILSFSSEFWGMLHFRACSSISDYVKEAGRSNRTGPPLNWPKERTFLVDVAGFRNFYPQIRFGLLLSTAAKENRKKYTVFAKSLHSNELKAVCLADVIDVATVKTTDAVLRPPPRPYPNAILKAKWTQDMWTDGYELKNAWSDHKAQSQWFSVYSIEHIYFRTAY